LLGAKAMKCKKATVVAVIAVIVTSQSALAQVPLSCYPIKQNSPSDPPYVCTTGTAHCQASYPSNHCEDYSSIYVTKLFLMQPTNYCQQGGTFNHYMNPTSRDIHSFFCEVFASGPSPTPWKPNPGHASIEGYCWAYATTTPKQDWFGHALSAPRPKGPCEAGTPRPPPLKRR
jgi:hypothetical protein